MTNDDEAARRRGRRGHRRRSSGPRPKPVLALACVWFAKYLPFMSAKPSLPKDPVADAIANAPVATQPISDDERRLIEEGRAAIAAGQVVTQEHVEARLAEKRRQQKGT